MLRRSSLHLPALAPGRYRLGTRTENHKDLDLCELEIMPRYEGQECGAGPRPAGAWRLSTCSDGRVRAVLRLLMARLGLWPVRFNRDFARKLNSERPIGLIADTSALYCGAFEQTLPIRRDRPTFLAIPDQVYMELQRQRERTGEKRRSKPNDPAAPAVGPVDIVNHWIREQAQRSKLHAIPRVFARLRQSGRLVQRIEPPVAKIRYFGSERGAGAQDEVAEESNDLAPGVADNFYRDRLILEAVREARAQQHELPVWLVTSDDNLARQALLEGFLVGLGRPLAVDEDWSVGSPYINPYTLDIRHISYETLLTEFLCLMGVVSIQKAGTAERKLLTVPLGDDAERIWTEFDDEPAKLLTGRADAPRWQVADTSLERIVQLPTGDSAPSSENSPGPSSSPQLALPVPGSSSAWPVSAVAVCGADTLIYALLQAAGSGISMTEGSRDRRYEPALAYLKGLGWVRLSSPKSKRWVATELGKRLAGAWLQLNPREADNIPAWAAWLGAVADQIRSQTPQQALLAALPSAKGVDIADSTLPWAPRTREKQVALGEHFGTLIRLHGRVYAAQRVTEEEAASLLLAEIPAEGTRVDRLFLRMVERTPLSVPNFRLALWRLHQQGRVRFGGSLPDATDALDRSVVVRVLQPGVGPRPGVVSRTVDLGAGDFLVPGVSCQVVLPTEPKS